MTALPDWTWTRAKPAGAQIDPGDLNPQFSSEESRFARRGGMEKMGVDTISTGNSA
jgi:hypothetical protein